MRRHPLVGARIGLIVAAIVSLAGCIHFRGDMVALRLSRVAASMTAPSEAPRRLVYRVEGSGGTWLHEVVLGERLYAERRTREDGSSYAYGRDELGVWLTVDGTTVAVDGDWAERVETLSALHRVKFLRPSEREAVTYLGRDGRYWELSYRPEGGQTLTFFVDRTEHRPKKLDYVDDWARIVSCHHMRWAEGPDGTSLASLGCDTGNGSARRSALHRERISLLALTGLTQMPSWTRPAARRSSPMPDEPVMVEITDPERLHLPVEINGVGRRLLLDSGAFHTILSEEAAAAAGVVPTGEPALYVTPPWLAETELWVGVAHTLRIGHAVVHGARVLVAKNDRTLGPEDGLLGRSVFERFVIDVDSPAGLVRIWSHDAFRRCLSGGRACQELERIATTGPEPRIEGEIVDVAHGPILLDTGMTVPMVVLTPRARWRMPRRKGSAAALGPRDDGHSVDYFARVPGVELGPFDFPAFDGVARGADREAAGPHIAIAGMGLLRYLRLAFDLRGHAIYASAGWPHAALLAVGLDVEDGPEGPRVTRVLERSRAARAGLRAGDVIRTVELAPVATAGEACAALLAERGMLARVAVERGGHARRFVVDVPR